MIRRRNRARSPEDQQQVRERFIACARDVFAREGAAGLTMRRLASEAGYSPGTIYLYFPSRSDLLREVWKEDILSLTDTLQQAAASKPPGRGNLRALLEAYTAFWFAKPDHFKVMFLEVDRQYVSERAAFAEDESVQAINQVLLDAVSRAMSVGEIRTGNPSIAAHGLLASVHGVVSLHIGNPGFPWADRDAMVSFVLEAVLAGLSVGTHGGA